MNAKQVEKKVARVAGSLFGKDRMMMKKHVTVDNSFYRKDDPDRILWHGRWSVEINVCVVVLCALLMAAGVIMAVKGMGSRLFRRKK
ncbi:MAG: hypothetical protein IJS78_06205 [Clostridia bacterium]|nr:hypothetical protein [Clostridia bacterium]